MVFFNLCHPTGGCTKRHLLVPVLLSCVVHLLFAPFYCIRTIHNKHAILCAKHCLKRIGISVPSSESFVLRHDQALRDPLVEHGSKEHVPFGYIASINCHATATMHNNLFKAHVHQ